MSYMSGYIKGSPAVTILILILHAMSAESEANMWTDDFEHYNASAFPSSGGWELIYSGAGTAYQYIDDSNSYLSSNSLHLTGSSCWAAHAYHPVDH